ncbi:hypothetical protein N7582_001742 [Saccharomyces uvarum]|uniref:Uncharacterized protein n=1 Tax=Saccharomyces uvarum TaxID=230603 RepID=A0AA35NST7_SACUV|nr:hypothetical protein N7582_001742 [Saccharomyces uvarum]CAI4060882.1 hypothetical protein SUVC_06G0680 [Saccharomyces uvarum]
MQNSHLNAPQLGTSQSYARSQDFLNMDEPPSAQETPSVSTFNLPGPTAPAPTEDKPAPMLRRRSTNYMDALSSRAQARERESSFGEHHAPIPIPAPAPAPAAERRSSGPMDFQNTIHDLQYQTTNTDSDMGHAGVDMGDSISHTPAGSSNHQPIFKSAFLDNNSDTSGSTRIPRDAALPPDVRRKSSFKYEDFKKDIYNQLHMFEDK